MIRDDVDVVDSLTGVPNLVDHLEASIPRKAAAPDVVRVGVIGYGYWGPNIVRNFHGLDNAQVMAVCDKNPAALRRAGRAYPGVK